MDNKEQALHEFEKIMTDTKQYGHPDRIFSWAMKYIKEIRACLQDDGELVVALEKAINWIDPFDIPQEEVKFFESILANHKAKVQG